jgi:putative AlgH/UPF0301 family transcriptional regulator
MASQNNTAYFNGKLLLAMPGLTDPRFHRAVILLCAHDEKGAMGLGDQPHAGRCRIFQSARAAQNNHPT